jgi:hypothetical protein
MKPAMEQCEYCLSSNLTEETIKFRVGRVPHSPQLPLTAPPPARGSIVKRIVPHPIQNDKFREGTLSQQFANPFE